MKKIINFSINLSIAAMILIVATYLLDKQLESFTAKPIYYMLYIYAWALNVSYGIILLKTSKEGTGKTNMMLMLSSLSRLFGYLFFVIVFIIIDKTNVKEFVAVLAVTYFIFTVFDTMLSSKLIKS